MKPIFYNILLFLVTTFLICIFSRSNAQYINITEITPISCAGQSDGVIQVIDNSIGTNLNYLLDGSVITDSMGIFTSISAGIHTVCALGLNDTVCGTIVIYEPEPLNITFITDSIVSCHGGDAQLEISVSGGTILYYGYTTCWRNGIGDTLSESISNPYATVMSNLSPGLYSVTVIDDHGCSYSEVSTIAPNNPIVVSATYNPAFCNYNKTPIILSASGGVTYSPYTFLIDGIMPLASYSPGLYSITAIDTKGCTATTLVNVASSISSATIQQTGIGCNQYLWYGKTYSVSGIYTHTTVNNAGCIDTVRINLVVNHSSASITTLTVCNSYTWTNGQTYNAAGVFTYHRPNAFGCDSFLTLYLTLNHGVRVSPKILLSGSYIGGGLMHDSLRRLGLIPLQEPNSALSNMPPYGCVGYTGGEKIGNGIASFQNAILANHNNVTSDIVDWVYVQLVANDMTTVIASQNALLQRDGDVVIASDGNSPLFFQCGCPGNAYYIVVKHRNHLGVMSSSTYTLSLTTTVVNLRSANAVWCNPAIENTPRRDLGNGFWGLWAGDANCDKSIKYNGLNNDKDFILSSVGVATPNNILYPVYRKEDVNMDGKVMYNNSNNDKNFILDIILSSSLTATPNTVIYQHIP